MYYYGTFTIEIMSEVYFTYHLIWDHGFEYSWTSSNGGVSQHETCQM